uniref:Mitochondrial uncoupling protein 4 n=1 Tax=Steinernema glaseri TaxID=37863 RepID=A0A1I7Z842_9BILA
MRAPADGTTNGTNGGVYSIALKYFLSCSAALVAETVTYPLDITKTRLQILSHAATPGKAARPRGMFRVTFDIVRHEGPLSLWRGVAPAIYRHYVYTGIRMGTYEFLRGKWFDKKREKTFSAWKSMTIGLFSGAFAQFVASPADLVKVQMQMEGLRKLQNLPPRFHSTWHAFVTLYRANGFFGLWIGWVPNCQRAALLNMADLATAALLNMADLATYDRAKHWLLANTDMKDNAVTHGCSSACAGLAAATVSTPADVVKTRIMDQLRHKHDFSHHKSPGTPLYKGSIDCLMHIVRTEGFFALYRGFLPIYIRMAPWSLTFWISYEKIRQLTGAPSF